MNDKFDTFKDVLDRVVVTLNGYAKTRRYTTKQVRLNDTKAQFPDYRYNPEDDLIRETLLEHVGALASLAMIFYPYIDNADVDLGLALKMLAVHDVGELVVGDEITFLKKSDSVAEKDAALKLLHPANHAIYLEAEDVKTPTAKFAKAVDKISADVEDYITESAVTVERFGHFMGISRSKIVPLIKKHKRPYMEWNEFMTGFHDYLMEELEKKLRGVKAEKLEEVEL